MQLWKFSSGGCIEFQRVAKRLWSPSEQFSSEPSPFRIAEVSPEAGCIIYLNFLRINLWLHFRKVHWTMLFYPLRPLFPTLNLRDYLNSPFHVSFTIRVIDKSAAL